MLTAAAGAQTTMDPQGIRTPGVRIDAGGIHRTGASVDADGVDVAGAGRGVTILTNGGHRSVDCHGSGLTVNGNGNRLAVADCRAVVIAGNGNIVAVRFVAPGRVSVVGNDDRVTVQASRDVWVSTAVTGRRSTIARPAQ